MFVPIVEKTKNASRLHLLFLLMFFMLSYIEVSICFGDNGSYWNFKHSVTHAQNSLQRFDSS